MPVLLVYGIPKQVPQRKLKKLCGELRSAVASVKTLNLTAREVTVFFPADMLQEGLGEEIICSVFGLLKRPERTPEVRHELAVYITQTLGDFCDSLPALKERTKLVEVFVRSFGGLYMPTHRHEAVVC